jgi:hypothetical protein
LKEIAVNIKARLALSSSVIISKRYKISKCSQEFSKAPEYMNSSICRVPDKKDSGRRYRQDTGYSTASSSHGSMKDSRKQRTRSTMTSRFGPSPLFVYIIQF